jgi:hypothetical protein
VTSCTRTRLSNFIAHDHFRINLRQHAQIPIPRIQNPLEEKLLARSDPGESNMNQLEEETRALCEKGEFDAALRLCDQELSRAPQLPSVIILRKNIVDCRRMAVLEMMRRVSLELSGSHSLQAACKHSRSGSGPLSR